MPVVAHLVIVETTGEDDFTPESMIVLKVEITLLIRGAGARVVEDCAKRSSRNLLSPRTVYSLQGKSPVRGAPENLAEMVPIGVFCDTVVCHRAVKFAEKQAPLPQASIKGCGENCAQPLFKSMAIGEPALVRAEAA